MSATFTRAAVFLAALLVAGCGPAARRADLVVLNGAEPESLDPAIITGQPEGRIVQSLFEGLAARDPDGRVVPGVAERWEVSADGRCYLFHLRADARWSNGDPVTARDFAASWRRTLAPETASEYAYQLFYVRGAEGFNAGREKDFSKVGVRARDERTLEVELEDPTPFFLDLCAFPTLMPVHLASVERFGDDWIKPGRLVSNGAFLLEDWRVNHRVRLMKNPHYWDRANVALETVDILPTSQANTAFNLYWSGEADLILDRGLIPSMLLNAVRKRRDFHSAPFLGTAFYRFNVTRKPFSDVRVRKAFALVVDKRRLVEKVTRAGELIADSLVPPGLAGYASPKGLGYDPAAARALLAEAGFPGGKGFPEVALLYNRSEQHEAVATEVQDMLAKELGIRIELLQQEWKVYLNSMSALDYDFCRASWVGDYADPNTFLDMFVTGGGNNRTGWSNTAYDALLRAAAKERDPSARMRIFQRAETLLCRDEVPILPLHYYVGVQFYDPDRVTGFRANVLDEHPLKYVRLRRAAAPRQPRSESRP
ncbi:MAG: peptide ABC transporter substrate-binding protein [Verrucomicrobiae bacterium]|nr:peptide ABC transporter substrate-binding protein [Verrucomicrobiae bacterium]